MSLKSEKVNAIKKSREFLRSLLDPKKTPKVPKKYRREAYWCLRHFPFESELKDLHKILGGNDRYTPIED